MLCNASLDADAIDAIGTSADDVYWTMMGLAADISFDIYFYPAFPVSFFLENER
jgi:hypothetical protein